MALTLSPELATGMEWSAVALNIAFTILIGLEKRIGWLLGLVAAILGVLLYIDQDAWLMAALNGFYAAMGAYGWWNWGRDAKEQRIVRYGWKKNAVLIMIGLAVTGLLVFGMEWMDAPGKYRGMEAFISAYAIIATWLMSAKALENWVYWTIGDAVAVVYNHLIGYNGYALLNIVYIVLAVIGFIRWLRHFRAQQHM